MLTLDFVKIDLSVFFDDFREKSLIRINSNWQYVEDLQKHVEKLFNLSSVLFVNKDGYFLHPKEDVDIVKINNDLRAVASNDVFADNKTKKSKSRSNNSLPHTDASETANEPTSINESKKKRKLHNLQEGLSTSTPKDVKRYKKHISRCVEITSTSETIIKQSTHVESAVESLMLSLIAPETSSKHKKKSKAVTDDKMPNKSKQNHIYFNESGERVSTTSHRKNKKSAEKHSPQLLFRCPLNNNDATPTPRFWNTDIFRKSDNTPKIIENILLKSKYEPMTVENITTDGKTEINAKENVNVTKDGIQENSVTIESKSKENVKPSNNATADEVTPPMVRIEGDLEPKEKAKDESVSICVDISMEVEEESINETPEKTTDNSTTTTTTTPIKHDNHMMPPTDVVNDENQGKHRTTEREVKENDTLSHNATNDEETSLIDLEDYTVNKSTPECIDLSMEAEEELEEKYRQLKSTNNTPRSVKSQTQMDPDLLECIDLNKTDDDANDVENSKRLSFLLRTENIKIDNILPYCIDIQEASPHLGDILIFKVPYINNKQQTLHTAPMAGKCEHINKRTKLIKMLILDGFNALQNVPQKFISITDDSLTNVQYLKVKLSDLTNVKILAMN